MNFKTQECGEAHTNIHHAFKNYKTYYMKELQKKEALIKKDSASVISENLEEPKYLLLQKRDSIFDRNGTPIFFDTYFLINNNGFDLKLSSWHIDTSTDDGRTESTNSSFILNGLIREICEDTKIKSLSLYQLEQYVILVALRE